MEDRSAILQSSVEDRSAILVGSVEDRSAILGINGRRSLRDPTRVMTDGAVIDMVILNDSPITSVQQLV